MSTTEPTTTPRTTYLRTHLALLCTGQWSPEWGAKWASETLQSPMVATDARDSHDFRLPTDAYATALTTDEMGLVGTLRGISERRPDSYSASQMMRRANETLSMQYRQMTEREHLLVKLIGGPAMTVSDRPAPVHRGAHL